MKRPASREHRTSPDAIRWWTRGRSTIHRHGLFAARDIPRGTRVIEYVGHKLTKAQGWKRATAWLARSENTGGGEVFVFELNKRFDIDGNVAWNTARHINHACDPNCVPRVIRGHIWIVARRRIRAGEELTYDYGYDLAHYKDHPCRCGGIDCVGFIVAREHRNKVRATLARTRRSAAAL